ncbi:MAG TPA: SRPBCC family protein [Pseudonocardia sp.]|nr:SRPBCC family protein [Pseudonocardia sp.]
MAAEVPAVRVALHRSATVSASADELWDLITDWAGMSRWRLTADDGGVRGPTLASCELVGAPHELPRTRRMLFDNGGVVEERLFHQDDGVRRIYYTKSDSSGSTGYLATTYVDAIDVNTCAVHIASWFDVRAGADPLTAAAWYEGVYDAMFRGFQRYFAEHGTARGRPR